MAKYTFTELLDLHDIFAVADIMAAMTDEERKFVIESRTPEQIEQMMKNSKKVSSNFKVANPVAEKVNR